MDGSNGESEADVRDGERVGPRISRRDAMKGIGAGLAISALPGLAGRARAQATPVAGADRATVEAALATVLELAEAAMRDGAVPGLALGVVHQDEVIFTGAYGVRSATTGEPVTPDTVFQLASLAKPLSSTVVSAVIGTGAASWDSPVHDFLPTLELSDRWATQQLTLTDYLSHISGLGGDAGGDLERIGYERDEILHRLRFLELAGAPRSTYAYSNFGFTIGGEAAAAALDMTWEDAAASLLFEPLGMTSTSARYADFEAQANRAAMHVWIDGAWSPDFTFNSDQQSPAGGISSSVIDLTHWLRLLLADGMYDGKAVIPAAPLLAARTPLVNRSVNPLTGRPSFYGRGWNQSIDADGNVIISHAGAFSYGARTMATVYPARQLGIVVLTSAFPTGVPDGLADSLVDLVTHGELTRDWIGGWNGLYDSIGAAFAESGAAYATPPADPAPALPASAYTGAFANDYVGPVEIAEDGGGLVLRMGPAPKAFSLTHFERDLFTYQVDREPPAPLTAASFLIGPDGTAQALVLDYFAGNGQQYLPRSEAE